MAKNQEKAPQTRSLKDRLLDALRFYQGEVTLEEFRLEYNEHGEIIDILIQPDDETADNPSDRNTTESTTDNCDELSELDTINILLDEWDDSAEFTVGEFLVLTGEIQDALKRDGNFNSGRLQTKKRQITLIDFADSLSRYRMDEIEEIHIERDSRNISVRVSYGFSAFTLAMMVKGQHLFSKYYPPVVNEEYFIEISWDDAMSPPDLSACNNYVDAVIFALHEELGISVFRCARQDPHEDRTEDIEDDRPDSICRPLLVGQGMQQVLSTYNKSHEPGSREFEYLQIAKTIEFVAVTVVRRLAHQEIRKRLNSPDVLRPNAAYINGLINLVSQHQTHQKDSEAFRLAVQTCCDAQSLAHLAPPCAKGMADLISSQDSQQKRSKDLETKALTELASIMYNTRCLFAHEKANYTLKGDECPESQLSSLIDCARLAARQCIRWYYDLSEHERVF